MSNLLKKGNLSRTPNIKPKETFSLNDDVKIESEKAEETQITAEEATEEKVTPKKATKKKRKVNEDITSVRVTKETRSRLNALIQLGRAENVDDLIDAIVDDYIEVQLTPAEKKTFNILVDVIKKRG